MSNRRSRHLRLMTNKEARCVHGYGLVQVTPEFINATLVTINQINQDSGEAGPGIKCKANFTIPKIEAGEKTSISQPVITGTPPFPFSPDET